VLEVVMRGSGIGALWTHVDRLRRRCGFDRNDLRRDIDRAQTRIACGLVLCFLAAAPVAGLAAGQAAYDRGIRVERHEKATRHLVTATVVEVGTRTSGAQPAARVMWTEPDGSRHTGTATAWRGTPDTGETQRMWVTDSGKPTFRPRWRSQSVCDAWVAGLAAALGVALPLALIYTLIRRLNDRRRYRGWDAAWERLDHRFRHS